MTAPQEQDTTFLEWALEAEKQYKPSQVVKDALAEKTLVALIGPFAIGKSYLSRTIAEIDPAFSEMGTISTRERDLRDPDHDRTGTSREDFVRMIENNELAQFKVHDELGQLYGSDLQSFRSDRIVTPALAGSLQSFENAGFGEIIPVGVVADPDIWQAWLSERREKPKYRQRLREAEVSLNWLQQELARTNIPIIENIPNSPERPGRINATARDIIKITNGDTSVAMKPHKARAIMDMMKVTIHRESLHGSSE